VLLEMALLKVCRPEMDPSIEGLAARVAALERQADGAPRPPTAGTPSAPPAAPAKPASRRGPRDRAAQSEGAVADAALPSGAAPSTEAAAADTEVGIDQVRARWGRFMDEVKQRSRPVYAFLLEAAPQSIEGTRLVLAVRHKFHLENLQEHKHRQIVEDLLDSVMGTRLRLGLVLGEGEAPLVAPASSDTPATSGSPSTLVEEAVRRFGNPVQEIRHPE